MKLKYTPYSYSKLATYKQCPKKFELNYIKKIKLFTENKALEKGSYIHQKIEDALKNQETNFNFKLSNEKDIEEYNYIIDNFLKSDIFNKYKIMKNESEKEFGLVLNKNLLAIDKFNKNCLIGGYIDYIGFNNKEIYIIDWKTGKVRDNRKTLQVKLYALWGFLFYPEVNIIKTSYVFVEHNEEIIDEFTRDDIKVLMKEVLQEIKFVESANEFKEKYSPLCDWCDYKKQGYCNGLSAAININI